MDSGIGMGMSEMSRAMGPGSGLEKFGRSGITLAYSPNPRAWDEKVGHEEETRVIPRGVRNPFLMDHTSTDAITPIGNPDSRSQPVRNRLLDDTAQPPTYDEAAAETTSRRFGGRLLSGGLFGRDRDRDRNRHSNGNNEEPRGSWNEKSEAYDAGRGRDDGDHVAGDEEKGSGAKKGWWKGKKHGLKGRFSLGLN